LGLIHFSENNNFTNDVDNLITLCTISSFVTVFRL